MRIWVWVGRCAGRPSRKYFRFSCHWRINQRRNFLIFTFCYEKADVGTHLAGRHGFRFNVVLLIK